MRMLVILKAWLDCHGAPEPLASSALYGLEGLATTARQHTPVLVRMTISKKRLLAVDHSARESMKDAASCENWCELQNTLSIDDLNANCGLGLIP